MKTIFTLILSLTFVANAKSQVILNELYCIPGNSRNEFFEFYNNSPSNSPEPMDAYTVITYFEEGGGKRGLYVMDLPSLSVAPRGYFVGSSDIPFRYQGVTGATTTDFSWNDLAFMFNNSAYLAKWVVSANVPAAIDGNAFYDLEAIPAGFNDFLARVGGNGATYYVFVYKNGNMVSAFFGGTGGITYVPNEITSLPPLFVDMYGAPPDFTIDFSTYSTAPFEFVIEEAGSDNGYIRQNDGFCGTWVKSSSQVTHTPQAPNNNAGTITGQITISSVVTRGNATNGSIVHYDVVAAPAATLPATIYVYLDNGTTVGQIDAGDTFVESNTVYNVNDSGFYTTFFPYDANIMLVVNTAAGCIDKIMFPPQAAVLPVKVIAFNGDRTELRWTVESNEDGKIFEIEKSLNGSRFTTVNAIIASGKAGVEHYSFNHVTKEPEAYYRLKIINKTEGITYSKTIRINGTTNNLSALTIIQNPVISNLQLKYKSIAAGQATVTVYSITGAKYFTRTFMCTPELNDLNMNETSTLSRGTYIVEIQSAGSRMIEKFIKN